MSKKVYSNFHDFVSILQLSKRNIISLPGLYPDVSNSYEEKQKLGQSFLTLIVTFMMVQSIALVTLNIVGFQTLRKISTFPMAPNIQEVK